jgi:hypothetical protein
MSETNERQTITGLLTGITKRDECVKIVKQLLTPEEVTTLGGENAADKVVDSVAFLGVFAPAPATFDKEAFLFTTSGDLPEKEGETIWNFCKKVGIIKDESFAGKERVSVSRDLVEMLSNTENGYLTED